MDKHGQNAQNVVSMSDYQSDSGFAIIAQIEAYWEALRGGNLLPKRSEVDPRGIEAALEYAFILERIAPGIARMRIAGSHLNELMGMEVRGMPLTAMFAPNARRQIADGLEDVFQTPATASLRLTSPGGVRRVTLDARMVLLPLKSDLGDVSRALGCLVSRGDIGTAPRRFDLIEQEVRPLVPGQTVARVDLPVGPVVRPAPHDQMPGFRAPKAPFKGKEGKVPPPYLRLVKSDK
ncbi:PAS domain-containing protein [Sulfitobacter sp. MF3-043]|uniref:PAS domain-containing protein n=1 Tax=Sulfitobacter sediminivivens TaxID=3252902 RepID=UPI0036DADB90